MAMNVLLHPSAREQLAAIRRQQSGSYIFHGARSVGKATAAYELARRLNCQGDVNGPCANCRRFAAASYPDYVVVRPEDKPSITIEQVRTIIQTLSLSPYAADGIRMVVIDAAELMTMEAQNALLKLIEEPPAQTIFVLVTERPASLLPTVRSRCAHIYFPRLADSEVAGLLVDHHGVASALAAQLAAAAAGAPGRAIELATHGRRQPPARRASRQRVRAGRLRPPLASGSPHRRRHRPRGLRGAAPRPFHCRPSCWQHHPRRRPPCPRRSRPLSHPAPSQGGAAGRP
jgi:DNA polymerase-3 subunit delta'